MRSASRSDARPAPNCAEHLRLGRQPVAGAHARLRDLAQDPACQQLGDLLGPLHAQPRIGFDAVAPFVFVASGLFLDWVRGV